MKLSEVYRGGRFGLSFELFPPKTDKGEAALYRHVEALSKYKPSYFTCTYGAGGSTRDKTLDIVERVKSEFKMPVASHLTCVGSTVDELRSYLREALDRNVDYIVALRGDPPQGEEQFVQTKGGLGYANELVALIRDEFSQLGIAVAGYPEVHQEAPSAEVDLENLKRKVDTGADIIITQLFYCNDDFFAFRDRCEKMGITAPLIPGILPVVSLSQIQRITSLCGAKLPTKFVDDLGKHDDAEWQLKVGIEQATQQVQGLIEGGVPGVHFYVLNKSQATGQVIDGLDLPT